MDYIETNGKIGERQKQVLAVVCVTYNQERYIAQALDSFLAQETTFPFQIYVGDDCSSDTTPDIIRLYAAKYPSKILPVLRQENIGAERNWIDLCLNTNAKYLAFCDGDDYWTDTAKLQKQYNLMETNPDLRACFHDTEILLDESDKDWFLKEDYNNTPDGKLRWTSGHKAFKKKDFYTIEDYIPCGFVHTSSMFVRWDRKIQFPEWYFDHILGDYTLWVLQVGLGRFAYLDEVMSVYRRHSKGGYTFKSRLDFWEQTKEDWIYIDEDLKQYFLGKDGSSKLIDAIEKRQKNDLKKLLKAKAKNQTHKNLEQCLTRHNKIVEYHTGVKLPKWQNPYTMQRYTRAVNRVFNFEPKRTTRQWIKKSVKEMLVGNQK